MLWSATWILPAPGTTTINQHVMKDELEQSCGGVLNRRCKHIQAVVWLFATPCWLRALPLLGTISTTSLPSAPPPPVPSHLCAGGALQPILDLMTGTQHVLAAEDHQHVVRHTIRPHVALTPVESPVQTQQPGVCVMGSVHGCVSGLQSRSLMMYSVSLPGPHVGQPALWALHSSYTTAKPPTHPPTHPAPPLTC